MAIGNFNYSPEGNPWPSFHGRIFLTKKVEYFLPVLQIKFYRKTVKRLIPPLKNKGWKGKR